MRDFSVVESENGEVIMAGTLTIENAAAVRGALLETLERREQIVLTVREDAVVDLSFLQIVCSLHRAARTVDKPVMQGSFSAVFVSTIVDAGFARNKGCAAGEENNCLWNIGGKSE